MLQTRIRREALERRRRRLVADRHETCAGSDDAERTLDEAATLARDEPAARRRRDAMRTQTSRLRIDALDERGISHLLPRRALDHERRMIRSFVRMDAD